jgi:hypothetical protein
MNSGRWHNDEKTRLLEAKRVLSTKDKANWKAISVYVGTRTAIQCRSHWQKLVAPRKVDPRHKRVRVGRCSDYLQKDDDQEALRDAFLLYSLHLKPKNSDSPSKQFPEDEAHKSSLPHPPDYEVGCHVLFRLNSDTEFRYRGRIVDTACRRGGGLIVYENLTSRTRSILPTDVSPCAKDVDDE